ncbi:embryo-specific protein ATS3B-like [Senna tora]|uniref:Embryo-specific protein ATS3B-like n=1 Tax=Senna tora TaxID=362788 RepID=A0A834WDL2_9FABA|nr:embryo-specific protein ATS3B-like [Senna tora]
MIKTEVSFLLFFFFAFGLSLAESQSSTLQPHAAESFNVSYIQIYAPRLDDPSSSTFERCSSDTFQIDGPCAYQICYVYLYRSGPDGWMPESVKIYGHDTKAVTFYYDTFIPKDTWSCVQDFCLAISVYYYYLDHGS